MPWAAEVVPVLFRTLLGSLIDAIEGPVLSRSGCRSRGVDLYSPAGTTPGASLASVSFTPITVRIAPAMDSAAKKYSPPW